MKPLKKDHIEKIIKSTLTELYVYASFLTDTNEEAIELLRRVYIPLLKENLDSCSPEELTIEGKNLLLNTVKCNSPPFPDICETGGEVSTSSTRLLDIYISDALAHIASNSKKKVTSDMKSKIVNELTHIS